VPHDRYEPDRLSGALTATLEVLSPVHVATGNLELNEGDPSLLRPHFRQGETPTLPGTSLKGAVRSIVEAISDPPSCVRVAQRSLSQRLGDAGGCGNKTRLCLACGMFGALGYLGRVRFRDALLTSGGTTILKIPSMFAPREDSPAYVQNGRLKGRKFYKHGLEDGRPAAGNVPVEACGKGARFGLRVDFDGLSRGELGLLLLALGQGDPPLFLKLGGGKPACCGSARVSGVELETPSVSALQFDPDPQSEEVQNLAGETERVNREVYAELASILCFPGDGRCPDGLY
jgi:hypothetical protein